MTSRHSLYKSVGRMRRANEIEKTRSKFQRKVNRLKVEIGKHKKSLSKRKMQNTLDALFKNILKDKYSNIYKSVLEELKSQLEGEKTQ